VAGEKRDLGPLPGASKALLTVLVLAWVLIGLVAFREYKKKK
jgi:multiple sugar transport system substrate-binding protein